MSPVKDKQHKPRDIWDSYVYI